MKQRKLVIEGRPVAKRYAKSGGQYYRPKDVKDREEVIAASWIKNYERFLWVDSEKLAFSIRAYYPDHNHADLKNIIYLAEDALSGVAYKDDRQIIRYDPIPFIEFCEAGEERTEIFVQKIKGEN